MKGITVVIAGFPEFENPEIAERDAEGAPTSGDTGVVLQGEGRALISFSLRFP